MNPNKYVSVKFFDSFKIFNNFSDKLDFVYPKINNKLKNT